MVNARNFHPPRLLLALIGTIAFCVSSAPNAQGNHLWTYNGNWVHMHTRQFPVYRSGINLWTIAAAQAESMWRDGTGVNPYFTNTHTGSRIHIIPGDYGDVPWAGLATTEEGWNGTTGHYTHGHNLYNWYYTDTSIRALHVACHEMGHSLGLAHTGDTSSCMSPGQYGGGPNAHDRELLTYQYGATGH